MTKTLENCTECGTEKALIRVPSTFFYGSVDPEGPRQVGALVNESIEDFKKDLELEKKRVKNKEWRESD